MSQFPTSNLSLSTVANALGRARNMNDLRGATVWDTNFSKLTVPALPTSLSLSYFFGKYYTLPFISPITRIINITLDAPNATVWRTISAPVADRNPTSFTVILVSGGGGGGGGGGGTYSVNNNASGGGGGGGGSGRVGTYNFQYNSNSTPQYSTFINTLSGKGGNGGAGSGGGDFGAPARDGSNGNSGHSVSIQTSDIFGNQTTNTVEGGAGGSAGGRAIYQSVFNGTPGSGGVGGSPGGSNGSSGSSDNRVNNIGGAGGNGGVGYTASNGITYGRGGNGGKGGNTASGNYSWGDNGSQSPSSTGVIIITWYYNSWLN